MAEKSLPRAYVNRRFHSLAGIWLVVFLLEHLITNSQAALYIGDWGQGFVKMVNDLHNLPYLQVVEVLFLGFPILLHAGLGIKYLFTSKVNSFQTDPSKPKLTKYAKNHAFTWQRITSWVLLLGIVLHIVQMRFLDYPMKVQSGTGHHYYMVRLNMDPGIYRTAAKLQVHLFNSQQIEREKTRFLMHQQKAEVNMTYDPQQASKTAHDETINLFADYLNTLSKKSLKPTQVMAVATNFGTATLLSVRETFKSPMMICLYTIFVIAACYHAFNGLWTAMISWGITLSARSQNVMRSAAIFFTVLLAFCGLAAIWLTYFVNLR